MTTDSKAKTGIVIAAAFAQGFLSMGFQLVGSRILAPYFGTTLIVWAFIIATFLAAFSIGAMAGGAISRREPARIGAALSAVAMLGRKLIKGFPLAPRRDSTIPSGMEGE